MDEEEFPFEIDQVFELEDVEETWKIVASPAFVYINLINRGTRESDFLGESPRELVVCLGEEFVPRKQLAEFRAKFGDEKGKTVFEMVGGCAFALEYLLGDLLGEVGRGDSKGPVTLALREALRRKGAYPWMLPSQLEAVVRRRKRGFCGRRQALRRLGRESSFGLLHQLEGEVPWRKRKRSKVKGEESAFGVAEDVGGVMEWVTQDYQWNRSFRLHSLQPLPLLLRYCRNVDPTHLATLLRRNQHQLNSKSEFLSLLRSLVIASPRSHDTEPGFFSRLTAVLQGPRDNPTFSVLSEFLRENLDEIPPQFRSLAEVFLAATQEQIARAANRPLNLASDVCVGGVLLNLLTTPQQPNLSKQTWEIIVSDVIRFTPCCEVGAVLRQVLRQFGENAELLKEVLTSDDVLEGWSEAYGCGDRKDGKNMTCGLTPLLSFYFSVFGPNLEWMEDLVGSLPVEIASALQGDPQWVGLLPPFQEILRGRLRDMAIVSVGGVSKKFSYQTEEEWEVLLHLINGEALQPGNLTFLDHPSSSVAAPLLRSLIKLYGVEWTKERLTVELWDFIFNTVSYVGSVGSLGSLLQSAIQLGELEEVERRAYPGVVKWRNAEGKNAFEVAREIYDKRHPIPIYLNLLATRYKFTSQRNVSHNCSHFPSHSRSVVYNWDK